MWLRHIPGTGSNDPDELSWRSCSISTRRFRMVRNKIFGQRRRREVTSPGNRRRDRQARVAERSSITMSWKPSGQYPNPVSSPGVHWSSSGSQSQQENTRKFEVARSFYERSGVPRSHWTHHQTQREACCPDEHQRSNTSRPSVPLLYRPYPSLLTSATLRIVTGARQPPPPPPPPSPPPA